MNGSAVMETIDTVLCNVTETENYNKIHEAGTSHNNEVAVTKEAEKELSLGDIWEWNLMYGIGNDVY